MLSWVAYIAVWITPLLHKTSGDEETKLKKTHPNRAHAAFRLMREATEMCRGHCRWPSTSPPLVLPMPSQRQSPSPCHLINAVDKQAKEKRREGMDARRASSLAQPNKHACERARAQIRTHKFMFAHVDRTTTHVFLRLLLILYRRHTHVLLACQASWDKQVAH